MAMAAFEQLTERETEVLTLIVYQHSDREISQILEISLNTVYKHVANVLMKLNVASRREAARLYLLEVAGLEPFSKRTT